MISCIQLLRVDPGGEFAGTACDKTPDMQAEVISRAKVGWRACSQQDIELNASNCLGGEHRQSHEKVV